MPPAPVSSHSKTIDFSIVFATSFDAAAFVEKNPIYRLSGNEAERRLVSFEEYNKEANRIITIPGVMYININRQNVVQ